MRGFEIVRIWLATAREGLATPLLRESIPASYGRSGR
jgi:hypothetical protein